MATRKNGYQIWKVKRDCVTDFYCRTCLKARHFWQCVSFAGEGSALLESQKGQMLGDISTPRTRYGHIWCAASLSPSAPPSPVASWRGTRARGAWIGTLGPVASLGVSKCLPTRRRQTSRLGETPASVIRRFGGAHFRRLAKADGCRRRHRHHLKKWERKLRVKVKGYFPSKDENQVGKVAIIGPDTSA
jgi:hypothetical protein